MRVTGAALRRMSDEALRHQTVRTDVFAGLPISFMGALALSVASYVLAAEVVKLWFYRRIASTTPPTRGGCS